jgi:hypothetical protein
MTIDRIWLAAPMLGTCRRAGAPDPRRADRRERPQGRVLSLTPGVGGEDASLSSCAGRRLSD